MYSETFGSAASRNAGRARLSAKPKQTRRVCSVSSWSPRVKAGCRRPGSAYRMVSELRFRPSAAQWTLEHAARVPSPLNAFAFSDHRPSPVARGAEWRCAAHVVCDVSNSFGHQPPGPRTPPLRRDDGVCALPAGVPRHAPVPSEHEVARHRRAALPGGAHPGPVRAEQRSPGASPPRVAECQPRLRANLLAPPLDLKGLQVERAARADRSLARSTLSGSLIA